MYCIYGACACVRVCVFFFVVRARVTVDLLDNRIRDGN